MDFKSLERFRFLEVGAMQRLFLYRQEIFRLPLVNSNAKWFSLVFNGLVIAPLKAQDHYYD